MQSNDKIIEETVDRLYDYISEINNCNVQDLSDTLKYNLEHMVRVAKEGMEDISRNNSLTVDVKTIKQCLSFNIDVDTVSLKYNKEGHSGEGVYLYSTKSPMSGSYLVSKEVKE